MAIEAELADGRILEFPDGTDPSVVQATVKKVLASSQAPASTERTWGEVAKDVGVSALQGVGELAQLPGQLYGLATGDFSRTGTLGLAKDFTEYAQGLKSPGLKAREEAKQARVHEAEALGQWEAFKAAAAETIKDPALLSSFLAEQAPQLIPAIFTGGTTAAVTGSSVLSKAAARGISERAAQKVAQQKAIKAGAEAAVQTGAIQQGADIGSSTYDEMYKYLTEQKKLPPEQAAAETINAARAAGVSGYALSLLGNKYLPGGNAIEKILAGERGGKGRLATAALTALKEVPGENVEEVGGQLAQNIAMRSVNPEQSLTQGLGETAAMASIGAGGMGGVTGFLGGKKATPTAETEPSTPPLPLETPDLKGQVPSYTPEAQVEELVDQLMMKGFSEADARNVAVMYVKQEEEKRQAFEEHKRAQEAAKQEAEGAKVPFTPVNGRVDELTQEFIGAGFPPQEARARAEQVVAEETQADAEAAKTTKRGKNAKSPVNEASGASVSVAGQPSAVPNAAGVEEPVGAGAVRPTENAADLAGGETEQPAAVTPEPTKTANDLHTEVLAYTKNLADRAALLSESDRLAKEIEKTLSELYSLPPSEERDSPLRQKLDSLNAQHDATSAKIDALDAERKKHTELDKKAKTPETVQAETQGQEAKSSAVTSEPTKTANDLHTEVRALEEEQRKLLTKAGKIPAVKSKARAKWDALEQQITEKKAAWDAADKAERQVAAPAAETPVTETPVTETPVTETPVTETPVTETPVAGETKRGRGRPKQQLTPEQLQAKQAEKSANRAAYMVGVRAFPKIEQQFNEAIAPVDESTIESDEHLAEVENDKRANKRNAIRQLLELDKQHRGTALGKKVKALLAHKSITPQEIADVKRGMEVAKKALADKSNLLGPVTDYVDTLGSSAQNIAGSTEADPAYSKMTTGAQAISHIIKTGTAFQKALAQRLRGFVAGVRIVVVEKGDPLPEQLRTQRNLKYWNSASGLYVEDSAAGTKTVYLRGASEGDRFQGVNAVTVLHELLHAAINRKLSLAIIAINKGVKANDPSVRAVQDLIQVMNNAKDLYNDMLDKGTLPPEMRRLRLTGDIFTDAREFVAYGMTDSDMQKFLQQAKGFKEDTSYFTRFVDAIRRMFGMGLDTVNALSDLIVVTDALMSAPEIKTKTRVTGQQVSASAKEEEVPQEKAVRTAKEIDRDVAIAEEKVRVSRATQEGKGVNLMQAARDPAKVLDIMKSLKSKLSYNQTQLSTTLPTMSFLVNWVKKEVPSLQTVHRNMQEMLGMSQNLLAGSEQIISSLRRTFKANPGLRTRLENLVYTTTIARIDPSDKNATERSKKLDAEYAALGEKGQAAYRMLRDYYKNLSNLYTSLLDEQINNIQGISPEARQKLLAEIRKTFENGAKIEPFFPLVRTGDFWLAVHTGQKDKNGRMEKQFFMFKTREERTRMAEQLAAERRTSLEELLHDRDFEQGNDVGSLRRASQNSSAMLKQVFEAIDAEDLGSPDAREGLKDAIYQIYLNTMPEQSFRNMFIHRKNRAGFSVDLINNVAVTASKMAVQLPRIKYAPKLRMALSSARDAIAEREELSPYVQEMEKRVNEALSGRQGGLSDAVAGAANKVSYLWYLSGASSALIQPFSIFISALPVLGANHGNILGAAAQLGKMVGLMNQYGVVRKNVDGTTSYTAPSLANNTNLPEDERRAIKEMVGRGVNQSTHASLVWNYKQTPTDQLDTITAKGKELGSILVGGLMHNTERLSREATYLASYRMGRERGLSYDAAVDQAVADTNEALGNYDINERPRFMQKGIGKIAFQFKMYPLQMTLLLLTNFKRMLPFLNKEGKKAAAVKFFGMMGTSGLIAGAAGLPMFSAIMGLVGWAWKAMQDDDDWPEDLRDKDFETWFRREFLPEQLGDISLLGTPLSDWVERGAVNAVTGWDISSRAGLNDLWGRDTKEAKTNRESFVAWALDTFGGPTASLGLSMIDAYDAYAMGDYQKALEKSSPAVIRNLVVANKYATEGMKTGRGAEIVPEDSVKAGELLGQTIGFRPDRMAKIQEANFKLTGIEQRVLNERDKIMRRLNMEFRNGADGRFGQIIDNDVVRFNARNPEYAIDGDDIEKSILKQEVQRISAQAGVSVTEKNARLFSNAVGLMDKGLK